MGTATPEQTWKIQEMMHELGDADEELEDQDLHSSPDLLEQLRNDVNSSNLIDEGAETDEDEYNEYNDENFSNSGGSQPEEQKFSQTKRTLA